MQYEEPQLVGKICQMCGKLDMMNPRGLFCKECKKKRYNKRCLEHYWKHREEILAKNHSRKNEKQKTYAQHEKPRSFPVVFNCKEGFYNWEVRFKSPITGQLVVWQSDGNFKTIMDAKKDFSKACGR